MSFKCEFGKGLWNPDDFMYVYSPICKVYEEFIQEDNCIRNSFNDKINDFDYISMVTKEKHQKGCTISTKCSFDKFGAPLIVLADSFDNANDRRIYNFHFEFVAYEDGFNVWRIVPLPERKERPIDPTKICRTLFKIADESMIDLKVEVKEKSFVVTVNGIGSEIWTDEIPESFHAGITACEGINKFYSFSIE